MADFVAGWVGGISILLVGHPFETVKVRLQGSTFDYRKVTYRNSVDCALRILQNDGIRGFYRGIAAPMLSVGVASGAMFFVYGHCLNFFAVQHRERALRGQNASTFWDGECEESFSDNMQNAANLTLFENMVCAAAGGCVHAFVMTPFEMIRIRLQTADMFPHRKYFGAIDCGRTIYREGGMRKLYRGLQATIIRDVPGSIVYLGSYGILRSMLPQERGRPNVYGALFAGGCAGVAQWLVVFPLDTIKTRRQIAKCGHYVDLVHVARDLWTQEGLPAFYYGIAPALGRAFLANAACFAGVESVLWFVRGGSSQEE
jgi:solute carrier family 25 (mitochondrial carnitine/acylcarnitine transporter), member 20/29